MCFSPCHWGIVLLLRKVLIVLIVKLCSHSTGTQLHFFFYRNVLSCISIFDGILGKDPSTMCNSK